MEQAKLSAQGAGQRVSNTVARGIAVKEVIGTLDQAPWLAIAVVRTGSNGQTLPENVRGIHGIYNPRHSAAKLRRSLDDEIERLGRSARTDGTPTARHSVCCVVATLDSRSTTPERRQAGSVSAQTAGDEGKDAMLTNWQRRRLHDGEGRNKDED
ncbi:uncharacterized protein Triagg1_7614 [Trichoderma aggressivum f. europaeum]|uniref:Uncharacterized protein n=1 Tax=Trichoderma aggressivum f. europaeum TaxID=173218 RepID=A0AAE1M0Q7_9HYPO|nr:hypothetical protein Triagg1_7614 [Trichoderma aggressivum f. europaeum]